MSRTRIRRFKLFGLVGAVVPWLACSTGSGGGGGGGGGSADGNQNEADGQAAENDNGAETVPDETTFDISFPETGDAVVTLEEQGGPTSVTFYGQADPDAGTVTLTDIQFVDERGTSVVTLDELERIVEFTLGTTVATIQHNDDGTVNVQFTADGVVFQSLENVSLDDFDLEEVLALKAVVPNGESSNPACRAYGVDHGDRLQGNVLVTGCTPEVAIAWSVLRAYENRGYYTASSTFTETPVYACLLADDWARELGYARCVWIAVLTKMQSTFYDDCVERYSKQDYCARVRDKVSYYSLRMGLLTVAAAADLAETYLDTPECGCAASACPTGFVCTEGQCYPKCSSSGDCPSDKNNCTSDGECLPGGAEPPPTVSDGEFTEQVDAGSSCDTATDLGSLSAGQDILVNGKGHDSLMSEYDYFAVTPQVSGHLTVSATGDARSAGIYDENCEYLDGSGIDPGAVFHDFMQEVEAGKVYYIYVYTFPGEYLLGIGWFGE